MVKRLIVVAMYLLPAGSGCTGRTDPITQPPPPGVKFAFPRGSPSGIVNVDWPIPVATEVEYTITLDESMLRGKNVNHVLVKVHETDRKILQMAQPRRSGAKDGAALFKGTWTVHEKGPAIVRVFAPRAPRGPPLAEYSVRYE